MIHHQDSPLDIKKTTSSQSKGNLLSKKAYICGRGAVGLTLGNQLAKHLKNFAFIVDEDRKKRYDSQEVKVNGKPTSYRYLTPEDSVEETKADLIFFSCKFHDLEKAIEEASYFIGPETILMSGINGIESEDMLKDYFPLNPIIHAISQNMDSVYDSKNQELHFTTPGETVFGPKDPSLKKYADEVEELFKACEVPYIYSDDILLDQYRKLMFNCGINQVCAAFDATYGEVANDPKLLALFRQAMEEAREVITVFGKDPGQESLENWVKKVPTFNPDSLPSMAQDLRANRWVELDLFAGTIIPMGMKDNIKTPVNIELAQKILEKRYEITKRNEEKLRNLDLSKMDFFLQESQLLCRQGQDYLNETLQFLKDCEKSADSNEKENVSFLKEKIEKLYTKIEEMEILCKVIPSKSQGFSKVASEIFEQLKARFSLIEFQIKELLFLGLLDPSENIFGEERKDYYLSRLEDNFSESPYFLEEAQKDITVTDISQSFFDDFDDISYDLEERDENKDLKQFQRLFKENRILLAKIRDLFLELEEGKRSPKALFKKILFYVKKVKSNISSLQLEISTYSQFGYLSSSSHLKKIYDSLVEASTELNKRSASLAQDYPALMAKLVEKQWNKKSKKSF